MMKKLKILLGLVLISIGIYLMENDYPFELALGVLFLGSFWTGKILRNEN